jgi:hypothetical protein
MSSPDSLQRYAEQCFRLAQATRREGDRALWTSLAQSWLRAAEQLSRTDNNDMGTPGLPQQRSSGGRADSEPAADKSCALRCPAPVGLPAKLAD